MGNPKQVKIDLIDPDAKPALEPYKLLAEVRKSYHKETLDAKIALAWRKDTKPDTDGHLVLGRCVKASDLQRELAEWDFVILLNQEVWNEPEFDIGRKRALLDHELCHADVSLDDEGEQKVDSKGRKVWRVRKHDIEEFQAVVKRHGCYKKDLEVFAEALMKQKNPSLFPKDAKVEELVQ